MLLEPLRGLGSRPWENSGLLHFSDGFSNIWELQGHGLPCWGGMSSTPAWVWSRKHYPLAAKVDFCFIASAAIPGCFEKRACAWNFSLCLFSLTVVLISIFLWSSQTAQGCSWKAKTNSRSGFLLFAIIICEKLNQSSLCSDWCMNTLKNF